MNLDPNAYATKGMRAPRGRYSTVSNPASSRGATKDIGTRNFTPALREARAAYKASKKKKK